MDNQKTILIADDDPTLRKGMEIKFKSAGYNVITAADGEEAINNALELKPDLIVMDQLMPKFTGLAALKRIRSDFEWGRHVPTIVMTNVAEGTSAHRELVLVANRYFVKSNTSLDLLLKTAAELLGEAEAKQNGDEAQSSESDAPSESISDSNNDEPDQHEDSADAVTDEDAVDAETIAEEKQDQPEEEMTPQAPQNTTLGTDTPSEEPQSQENQDNQSDNQQSDDGEDKDIDEDLVNQAL